MNTCSVEGCEKPVRARGWCGRHYVRWLKHGDPTTLLLPGYDIDLPREPPNPSGLCMCGCGQKTSIATRSDKKYGAVAGEHRRYIMGHSGTMNRGKRRKPLYEIDPETGCWNWLGHLHYEGYGYGRKSGGGNTRAHRLVWEEQRGPLSPDVHLHHECENRRCVNPDHMKPMNASEHHALHDAKRQG